MKLTHMVCILLLVMGVSSLQAADSKTEEAAIRAEIATGQVNHADGEIVWTGAYKRPFIRPEKGELWSADEMSKRTNEKTTTDVQRIEVASSGDLAYEFSYRTLDYDLAGPPPQHVAFKSGLLRVWKKVNGDWKAAAAFAMPMDIPFAERASPMAK